MNDTPDFPAYMKVAAANIRLEKEVDKLAKALYDAEEFYQWCSGSADFGPEGQAHVGYLKFRDTMRSHSEALGLANKLCGVQENDDPVTSTGAAVG
jgi:hypothetical protein